MARYNNSTMTVGDPSSRSQWRRAVATCAGLVVALAACGGSPLSAVTPTVTEPPVVSAAPRTAFPSASHEAASQAGPSPMPLHDGCSAVAPCAMSAGTWVTFGPYAFIPGLTITVPDGWRSQEQDLGEFNLVPIDHPGDQLLLWKDVAAATSDGTQKRVPGIPQTPDGLTAYFRQDPFLVVSSPMPAVIAGGIQAITYVVGVSPSAKFKDPTCPVFPRCADLLTDPVHWDGAYGFGAPSVVRLYLATVGTGSDIHLFVVGLDAPSPAELAQITPIAAPIIASIRLPTFIGSQ